MSSESVASPMHVPMRGVASSQVNIQRKTGSANPCMYQDQLDQSSVTLHLHPSLFRPIAFSSP